MTERVSNPASRKEKAEGSRENVNAPEPEERRDVERDRPRADVERETPPRGDVEREEPAARSGISNRPIEEERARERAVPPRGRRQRE